MLPSEQFNQTAADPLSNSTGLRRQFIECYGSEQLLNPPEDLMNADIVSSLAKATLNGSIPFPQIVGKLIEDGVDYYYVDYTAYSFTFYSHASSTITVPLQFEGLPSISDEFDAAELKATIRDSQQHGQKFRMFCERAIRAGVMGYFVFLRGQRVVYLGRQGDQHTEWFPGAQPKNAQSVT